MMGTLPALPVFMISPPLTPEQQMVVEEAVQSKWGYYNLAGQFVIPDKQSLEYGIAYHGNLEDYVAFRLQYEKQQQERRAASEARKVSRQAKLTSPGYLYIYRFWFDGRWFYKFRLNPARTARLELFRYFWADGGAVLTLRDLEKRFRRFKAGASYRLDTKTVMWIVDLPPSKPPDGWKPPEPPVIEKSLPSVKIRRAQGYVYVVRGEYGGQVAYKIGRTRNPKNRARTFGIELPFVIEFAALIQSDDMYSLESELHSQYYEQGKWLNGEWFSLTEADLDDLKHLAGQNPPDAVEEI